MKLSMWSSFYRELSPYDMILAFEKAGYKYTELSTEHADMLLAEGDAIEVGKKFGEFAKAHNVEVSQGVDRLICGNRYKKCSSSLPEYI